MVRAGANADGLSTSAVSSATGYSVQQVRDLEALHVITPASRTANGYRRFGVHHVRDLRAYRDLAVAMGPVVARRAMSEIRSSPPDEAVALVCSFHDTLNRERDQAIAAREALRAIRGEAAVEAEPAEQDAMTITELAGALGIRTSALRFWEKEGLAVPERVTTRAGSARRYPLPAIREARIVTALRAAGYGILDVRKAVTGVRELQDAGRSLAALDARIDSIAQRALALLRAGTTLSEIIKRRRALQPPQT